MSQFNRRSHRKGNRSGRNYYAGHKKTELCRDFIQQTCQRGSECSFAHGVDELKPRILEVGNYKTEKCQMWFDHIDLVPHKRCQYGTRCHFLHDETEWAKGSNYTILYSESEEMYRIIRKITHQFSKNKNKRGGECDEVRSCSSKWMPEQWLKKYEAQTKLDEQQRQLSEQNDVDDGFSTISSDVEGQFGSDVDTEDRSSVTSFGTPSSIDGLEVEVKTDVSSIVSSHVSSHVPSHVSSHVQNTNILPSTVSSVTQTPTGISLYEGSLLRMTSVSQQKHVQAQLTVEIPEPVTTIRGIPDSNVNTHYVQQPLQHQPQQQQLQQVHQIQQIISPPTQVLTTQPQPQQQQQVVQMQQSYIATYMPVLFPDGTTQMLPVLSPLTNQSSPPPQLRTVSSPLNISASTSSAPGTPQLSYAYSAPQPQQQQQFQALPPQQMFTLQTAPVTSNVSTTLSSPISQIPSSPLQC